MAIHKNSNESQSILVLGLAILIATVVATLVAIINYEDAVNDRKNAFETKHIFDEMNMSAKTWAILQLETLSNPNPRLSDVRQRMDIELEIDSKLASLLSRNEKSDQFISLINDAHLVWSNIKRMKSTVDFSNLRRLSEILHELDKLEELKVSFHDPLILEYTRRLVMFIVISLCVAVAMIILALYVKNRQDQNRLRIIEELNHLREDAVSASSLKSKFLSTVSHEIRTPLNGIIGLSDIILHTAPSADDRMYVKAIHQSGKTLLTIINDILDFSKIESGKFELENSDFSIAEVLYQVLFTLRPKAVEKGVSLSYEIDSELPRSVVGDPGRLSQILFNLVGNAIKFTSVGSVVVRVVRLNARRPTSRVEFSVEDTGAGISKEELKDLFIPFVQGRRKGTSGEPGSGLGLSISQHIINAMNGTIRVQSIIDKGSKFWFEIVFENCSLEKIGAVPSPQAAINHDLTNIIEPIFDTEKRPKILIVEDNPTNQIVAQAMLTQLGTSSILAANGREAIELTLKSKFHLILMDCQMPILDGFEATKEIRRSNIRTPIVAMTANVSKLDREICFNIGMDDFLEKPISLESLAGILRKFLFDSFKPTNKALVDLESKIGKEAVNRVVMTFILTIADFKKEFADLIDREDLQGLQRIGHKFKSSLRTVGDLRLAELCQQLEESTDMNVSKRIREDVLTSMTALESSLRTYI